MKIYPQFNQLHPKGPASYTGIPGPCGTWGEGNEGVLSGPQSICDHIQQRESVCMHKCVRTHEQERELLLGRKYMTVPGFEEVS